MVLLVSVAEPNRAMIAERSLLDNKLPALVFSASTNAAGDSVVGKAVVKRERCTNAFVNATLLFSKTVSQPVCPTITPWPIVFVSGRNSLKRTTGTEIVCVLPKVEAPLPSP